VVLLNAFNFKTLFLLVVHSMYFYSILAFGEDKRITNDNKKFIMVLH